MKTQLAQLLVRDSIIESDKYSWNGWWVINGKIYDLGTKEHIDWAILHPGLFGIPDDIVKRAKPYIGYPAGGEGPERKRLDEVWAILRQKKNIIRLARIKEQLVADLPELNETWYDQLRDALLEIGIKPVSGSVIYLGTIGHHRNILDSDEYDYPEFLAGNLVKIYW